MSTVSINNLSVSYSSKEGKTTAIQNISLELCDGGIYAVIGPSGCGKSTLLHTLGGIITEYQGEILINGNQPDPKIHSIGLVPQNYGLLPWKKVKENIFLAPHIRKQSFDKSFAEEVIQTLDLNDLLNRFPNELSGGQQQRVALARSFIQKPDLLLMDEPFSALDTLTAEKCRELFLQIWKKHKVTTLFITHNIEEAVKVGKHILLLSKCPGTITHIIENPILQPGADRSAESCFREATRIRELIKEEWI